MEMWKHGNFFTHVAWVVPDLRSAIDRWISTANVGPFFVSEHLDLPNLKYLGEPASWDQSVAIVQAGPIQFELIEQHCDRPSPYRGAFARGQGGIHHVSTIAPDFSATVDQYRRQGFAQVLEVAAGGVRVAMFDTRLTMGIMTEVVEDNPIVHQVNKILADAAAGWNGERPIRSFDGENSAVARATGARL